MKFTIRLTNGLEFTGEIVGDGGMVASLARAVQLIRYRIRHHEMLGIETWRNQYTGKYDRVWVDPDTIARIEEVTEKGKGTSKEVSP